MDFSRVLVVGASGRVGRMLARAWDQGGLCPTLSHRGTAPPTALPRLHWAPLEQPLPGGDFAAMIVVAGVVPGRGDLAGNAAIAGACLRAAEAAGIGQVLLASSIAVYGNNGGRPFGESDACAPVNDYGHAKLAMEAEAAPFRARGMAVTSLRLGNVAGADALLLNAASGQKLWLDRFADGSGPVRSYIGPATLARVLAGLVGRDLPAVLNLAAPEPVAMADLAQAAGVDWGWRPAPPTAHARITMDCRRLAGFCALAAADNAAAAMVAEWRQTRGQA